jgi:hypothetical protein
MYTQPPLPPPSGRFLPRSRDSKDIAPAPPLPAVTLRKQRSRKEDDDVPTPFFDAEVVERGWEEERREGRIGKTMRERDEKRYMEEGWLRTLWRNLWRVVDWRGWDICEKAVVFD